MYYHRHIEDVVKRISKRKPVVVLTGTRQVGKSTMLENVFSNINYIAMDHPLIREQAVRNPSIFFDMNKPPLIVDEIQKAPELFEYIKVIVDREKKKGEFYLTGSQSIKLMESVSESLAGRAGIVRMMGLSMREISGNPARDPFMPAPSFFENIEKGLEPYEYETIITRIHKGFFPELYETPSDLADWNDFYASYFVTYMEKDGRDVLRIRDETAFATFVRATASLTGQLLNMSTLAQICGKDAKTIKEWLSILQSSGLVYLLQPYHNNLNKRMTKMPKLHFLDTGLACWLMGWNTPQQMVSGAMWGHIFESFVFAEILKSYYNSGIVTPPLYHYRDKDKNEIDLIIADGSTLHPIEIKATSDPVSSDAKSFKYASGISGKEVGTGAVICLAKSRLPLTENAWILPATML